MKHWTRPDAVDDTEHHENEDHVDDNDDEMYPGGKSNIITAQRLVKTSQHAQPPKHPMVNASAPQYH